MTQVKSGKGLKLSVKVPTLETWSKAKQKRFEIDSKMPFIKKLRLIEKSSPIDWEKRKNKLPDAQRSRK